MPPKAGSSSLTVNSFFQNFASSAATASHGSSASSSLMHNGNRSLLGAGSSVSSSRSVVLGHPSPTPSIADMYTQPSIQEIILSRRNRDLVTDHKERAYRIAFQQSNDGIEVERTEFSLACPYSQMRMKVPARSTTCNHIQCCDLESWAALFSRYKSMRDPSVPCPVCESRVALSTIDVDEWIMLVLQLMPITTKLVLFEQNGSFRSGDVSRALKRQREEEEILDTQPPLRDHTAAPNPFAIKVKLESDAFRAGGDAALPFAVRVDVVEVSDSSVSLPQRSPLLAPPTTTTSAFSAVTATVVSPSQAVAPSQSLLAPQQFLSDAERRPAPAGWRQWTPYCSRCVATCSPVGAEALATQHAASAPEQAPFVCSLCQATRPRVQWPSFRSFSTSMSIEMTEDGTTVLKGVDGLSKFLNKGGFVFTSAWWLGDDMPSVSNMHQASVWYSSKTLTKYEIDFLETACEVLSRGGDPYEEIWSVPFLFKFRWGSNSSSYTQQTGTPSYSAVASPNFPTRF